MDGVSWQVKAMIGVGWQVKAMVGFGWRLGRFCCLNSHVSIYSTTSGCSIAGMQFCRRIPEFVIDALLFSSHLLLKTCLTHRHASC